MLIGRLQRNLADHGETLSDADRHDAEAALSTARSAMEGSDRKALDQAIEQLSQVAMKIGAQADKAQAGKEQAGPQGTSSAKPDGKVVDAEFEEVGDDRKSA